MTTRKKATRKRSAAKGLRGTDIIQGRKEVVAYESEIVFDDAFFEAMLIPWPPCKKVKITLELDADVVAWFQAQGPDWEEHINAVLRAWLHSRQKL